MTIKYANIEKRKTLKSQVKTRVLRAEIRSAKQALHFFNDDRADDSPAIDGHHIWSTHHGRHYN